MGSLFFDPQPFFFDPFLFLTPNISFLTPRWFLPLDAFFDPPILHFFLASFTILFSTPKHLFFDLGVKNIGFSLFRPFFFDPMRPPRWQAKEAKGRERKGKDRKGR